jgi:hypothetical protein
VTVCLVGSNLWAAEELYPWVKGDIIGGNDGLGGIGDTPSRTYGNCSGTASELSDVKLLWYTPPAYGCRTEQLLYDARGVECP